MKELFKVKNEFNEERQFYDSHKGEWIVVQAKKSVLSTSPPSEDGWKVTVEEKKEVKEIKEKPKKEEESSSEDD